MIYFLYSLAAGSLTVAIIWRRIYRKERICRLEVTRRYNELANRYWDTEAKLLQLRMDYMTLGEKLAEASKSDTSCP